MTGFSKPPLWIGLVAGLALCLPALAEPLPLYDTEQHVGPLGAAQSGPAAAPSCTGFDTACSNLAATFKPPVPAFAFDYGLSGSAGVLASNRGTGTSIGVEGWIKPVGSNVTIYVRISHNQFNPTKYRH
jgi:hypothetical protein